MDRLTIVMVRCSLGWLLVGVVIGGLMLVDRGIPGQWRQWLQPSHGHILFVGWMLQFALGIAYWLVPRKRSDTRPLGYRETPALVGAVALNVGIALRVVAEPLERTGHASDVTLDLLGASSVLQVAAVVIFVAQLWPRIYGRAKLGQPATTGQRGE